MNCSVRMKMISMEAKTQGIELDPGAQKMADALIVQIPRLRRFLGAIAFVVTGGRVGETQI